ncbi:MAG: SH3 domain-containing protein [Clostridiaceae bacterium]|nr:SH3 domain-containing protein [Clostridiaceae bacterium]
MGENRVVGGTAIKLDRILKSQAMESVQSTRTIQKAFRPTQEILNSIGALKKTYSPASQMISAVEAMQQDSVARMRNILGLGVSQHIDGVAAKMMASTSVLQEESFKSAGEMIKSVGIVHNALRPTSEIMKSMSAVQEAFKPTLQMMERMGGISGILEQHRGLFNSYQFQNTLQLNIEDLLGDIWENRDEVYEDDEALEEEIESAKDCLKEDISFEQRIWKLLMIFKEKHPCIAFIIYVAVIEFAIPYAANYVVDEVSSAINNVRIHNEETEVRTINKEIKQQVNITINIHTENCAVKKEVYNKYRFVTIEELPVRNNKRMEAAVIYKLHQGNIVNILYKNKNWTLIEYVDMDNDEIIKGWVLTRYISRFD